MALMYYAFYPEKGNRYLFPEEYRGWVCVIYNAKEASPLEEQDGFLLLKIPKSGIVKTPSAPRTYSKEGYHISTHDEYYYYSEKGIVEPKELAMGGGFSLEKEGSSEHVYYFWISTKENLESDYEKYVKDVPGMDENGIIEPVCGQWVKGEENE